MVAITITIVEVGEQIVSGIPNSLEIYTNIPSTIFYTLDGTTPDTNSNVYVSAIHLPTNELTIILKTFATNGMDSSAIITEIYEPDKTGLRLPHSSFSVDNNANKDLYPYGTNSPISTAVVANNADSGTNVYDPALPATSNAFDADGNPTSFTNEQINNYEIVYSVRDQQGRTGSGIGTLPTETTVIGKQTPVEYTPESSSKADLVFNPRALVVFQNAETDDPLRPPIIMPNQFSLQNAEIVSDGNLQYNFGPDTAGTSGSFVRSHYNPRTETMTSYYYDNSVNRWFISTAPFDRSKVKVGNLSSGMVFSRGERSAGVVFQWHVFRSRVMG